ncbi:hypothetical protein E3N88_03779 [Mikania micrantha]|uniref:Uncharacterized protein n=1 Tax=Mikania micrantha TaxID=192012 RepID=A0A5N6PUS1_9ASTR|nr:hypothetical protein E3N88_03779 [Mikania micrantha]
MSSDDEQVPQNIPILLAEHFQNLISDDVEQITTQLFALDAEDDVDSQEGSSSRQKAAAKKKKRERRKGIFVTFDLATFPADFPEFQPSDLLHFWTASSSHLGELIQRWVLFNNIRRSGFRSPVHSRRFVVISSLLSLICFHMLDVSIYKCMMVIVCL